MKQQTPSPTSLVIQEQNQKDQSFQRIEKLLEKQEEKLETCSKILETLKILTSEKNQQLAKIQEFLTNQTKV